MGNRGAGGTHDHHAVPANHDRATPRDRTVVVAGHVCLDLLPRLDAPPALAPGQLINVGAMTVRAGGCVANTGLDLANLGSRVRLVAALGQDHLGELLLRLLGHPAVDLTGMQQVELGGTSYSIVVEPPGADRSFWHHVGANAGFDAGLLDLGGGDLLHLGYPAVLPQLYRDGGSGLRRALDAARSAGLTTSVDLSTFASTSEAADEDWPAVLAASLPAIDVLAASADDLACAFGVDGVGSAWFQRQAQDLVAAGAATVLLKNGTGGLYLYTAGEERLTVAGRALSPLAASWADRSIRAPSIEVPVVSTAGAGDAAVAGLLYGILRGMAPDEAVGAASLAAAARVSRHGRLPGWPALARQLGDRCEVETSGPPGTVSTGNRAGAAAHTADEGDE